MLKVGDTIWLHDINRRVYAKDVNGRSVGAPIFSEQFTPYVISGETKKSWLITWGTQLIRVNKETMRSTDRFGGCSWHTEAGKVEQIWFHEHHHKIAQKLQYGKLSVLQLQAVGRIIGYFDA